MMLLESCVTFETGITLINTVTKYTQCLHLDKPYKHEFIDIFFTFVVLLH